MASVDIFPCTSTTYWSYDNGWGYQGEHWSAYAGPYFGADNHLVMLNNQDWTVVLQYIGRYPPVELWRGEVLNATDFELLVQKIEAYRLAYCERNRIDPWRDFEHELVLAQHGHRVEYRRLQFVPDSSGAMSSDHDAHFRSMTKGGRLASHSVQDCVEETGALYGHHHRGASKSATVAAVCEPWQNRWRAVSLTILWSVGAPVLLMLAIIALDDYPQAKWAVLSLGIVLIVAVPVVLTSRIARNGESKTGVAASTDPAGEALRVEAGWATLREELHRDIDAVAKRYGVQAWIYSDKEKWGELRVRCIVDGDEPVRSDANVEIKRLISAAAIRSENTCICCGQPAQTGKLSGRILPLCPEHTPRDDKPIEATVNTGEMHVLLQQWEESEREAGWGVTVRPDGYSVHRSPAALEAYLRAYWDAMPDKTDGRAPDYYSRPSGDPVAMRVALDHPLALALAARDSQRLLAWNEDTKTACWAAEQAWHAVAPGRGWHVERDWPKGDDKGKT